MHDAPGRVLLVGLLATGTMTTMLRASQALNISRMDLPFILGTAMTPDRDRAKAVGFIFHMLIGLALSFLYAAYFGIVGCGPLKGACMGAAHALFQLVVVMPLIPAFHPRMASESSGPAPTPLLEPPGFLGLNYGPRTPIISLAAHIVYGLLLGAFL